jgi:hypothetical protein
MTDTTTHQHQPGDRVKGKAEIGDRVTYFDMANQDGKVWVVVRGNGNSGSQYALGPEGVDKPTLADMSYSDLRQYGWTFA